jgi:hypothetical protein
MVSKAVYIGIFILAIVIFIALHGAQTYYNYQDLKYYEGKITDAQSRLDALDKTGFVILPLAYGYDFVYCHNEVTNTTITYPTGTDCYSPENNIEEEENEE